MLNRQLISQIKFILSSANLVCHAESAKLLFSQGLCLKLVFFCNHPEQCEIRAATADVCLRECSVLPAESKHLIGLCDQVFGSYLNHTFPAALGIVALCFYTLLCETRPFAVYQDALLYVTGLFAVYQVEVATHSGRYYRVERRYSAFHRFALKWL